MSTEPKPIEYTETIVPVSDEKALEEARHWICTRDDEGGYTLTRVEQPWIAKFLIAHGITFEIGPPRRFDQHDDEYVTLMLDGPLAITADDARTDYQSRLLEFIGTRRHIIWRTEPLVEQNGKKAQWNVYSRLTAYAERPP